MKFFDTFSLMSIFLLFAGFLSAQDCLDFPQNNLSLTTENCQSGIVECLPIDFEFAQEYEYTLNGSPYNGNFTGCAFETTATYDVLGIGNYPINVDSWEVNGVVISNFIAASPSGLADSLTLFSGTTWTFDDMSFRIETINPPDSVGWLFWTEIPTGNDAGTLPQFSTVPTETAFEFPIGNNVFVAYNFIEDCADTLLVDVVCEQITETLNFTIEIGEVESLVFDPTNLDPVNYFVNECATESGAFVAFIADSTTYTLEYTAIELGTEQACIVMCGINGICDTTNVFVTVIDSVTCTDPVIANVIIANVDCDEPGAINLFMEDQNQDYQFAWDNNLPNSDYVFNLEQGTYNVTVTYADSTQQTCFTTATYIVEFQNNLEPYDYTVTPSCDNNGMVFFTNFGLTYTWEDGFVGQERFDLFPGIYNVTVSSNNCEEVTTVVMPGSQLDISGSVNNVCDSLGAIFLDVVGDFPPFYYNWSDGVNTADPQRYGVDVGTYVVTVTDAMGCTAENFFEVQDDCPSSGCTDPVILGANITNPTCFEPGTILLEYQDEGFDYTFNWSEGNSTTFIQPGLDAGEYEVTITAFDSTTGTSCFTTASYTLVAEDSLGFFLVNSTPADCGNTGTAEYSDQNLIYNWSDGGQGYFRTDLSADVYNITVTYPNGNCEEVTFLDIPEVSTITYNPVVANVCDTLGSIYLFNPNGSYTYAWSNGSNANSQPEADVGFYSVTITNSQGCTVTESFEVVDDCSGTGCIEPVIVDVAIVNPDCMNGGMIDVVVENTSPNLTYLWSNGSDMLGQIIDLEAGFYSVTIYDFDPQSGDTCAVTETFVLTAQDSLGFFLVNSTPADCGGTGSAEYSDPSLIYNWGDGGQGHIRNDLLPGFYEITVTSPTSNCSEVTFLDIQETPTITYNAVVANVCDTLGSIYLFNPNGIYTYQWSNGTFTPDQPAVDVGVYSVTVTNDLGCIVTETFEIVDDCSGSGCVDPVIVEVAIENPTCMEGGYIDILVDNPSPNITYNWSNGADLSAQIDLPEGDYSVTITNFDPQTGTSCFTTATYTLIAEDSLGFSLVNITPASCSSPGSAEYSDPTLLYNWSDGGTGYIREDLAPGDYIVTVTDDQQNCFDLSFITIMDAGTINASTTVSNVCDTLGSIYMFVNGGTLPYAYDWADLPGTNDPQDRESIEVGNYSVTIIDANGCTLTMDFIILDDCPSTGDLIFTFVPTDEFIFCGQTAPIVNPIAESDCPGDITYDFTETQDVNCGNTNMLTRTWVATDDCGNTASVQQLVFEEDIVAPEIVTVGDFTVDLLNGDSLPDPLGFATAEDDCGLIADLSYVKEENITEDGYEVVYTWTAIDECGNLSTQSHTVDITGGMIWPGDTDSNKVVNNFDVFNIGFAYGETGPTRMNPTLDFLPQYAAPWSTNGLDDVNFRHADTDGNGIVDEQDILAVNLNYDLTHNLQEEGDTRETFDVNFIYETVTPDNWVHVAITLGNTVEPIEDFYGAGFIIEYDQNMVVPNTAHVDFSDSWTGTFFSDFIALQKDFYDEGRLDVGLVRTNQQGIDGSGKIGSFRFQLPEGVEFSPFMLTAREGEGVRADKSPYELETVEVVVTNVKDILSPSAIEAYPNPVQTELFLDIPTELEVTDIQMFGTNGQMVKEYTDVSARILEVGNLPAGLYYLRILTTEGTWTDKVSIMK